MKETRKLRELTEKDFKEMDKEVLIDIALMRYIKIKEMGYYLIKEISKK